MSGPLVAVKLLFIKLKVIGDALLLTPTLDAVRERHPDARIVVLVRKGSEGILAGCGAIDEVLTAEAPEREKRTFASTWAQLRLLRKLRRETFDCCFELGGNDRGRILAFLCGAGRRIGKRTREGGGFWKRLLEFPQQAQGRPLHQVERDYFTVAEFLDLPAAPPALDFADRAAVPWKQDLIRHPLVVVHPGTRKERKEWPAAKWAALLSELRERFASVVISIGPDPVEIALADRLLAGAGGENVHSTGGAATFAQLAWLLRRADVFVGVDTAAMHLASACGSPVAAIWGPSAEVQWRPWKARHLLVMPAGAEGIEPARRDIRQVTVEQVLAAVDELVRQPEERPRAHPR